MLWNWGKTHEAHAKAKAKLELKEKNHHAAGEIISSVCCTLAHYSLYAAVGIP